MCSHPQPADRISPEIRTLLDAIQGSVLILADDLCVLAVNRAAEELLDSNELAGRSFANCFGNGQSAAQLAGEEGSLPAPVRTRVASKGGRQRVIDWRFADWPSAHHSTDRLIIATGADVTDERQLWESEQHFRSIFDNSHDAILVIAPDDERVLEANTRACELYDLPIDELLASRMTDFTVDDNKTPAAMDEIRTKGQTSFDTRHRRRDGSLMQLHIHASIIDYFGTTAILTVNRDVTAEREMTDALTTSERRYRSAVENVPDVLWTVDENGQNYLLSSKALDVFGFTPQEMTGGGPGFWGSRLHVESLPEIQAAYAALFTRGVPYDVEYRFRRKDGTWIWLNDRATSTYEVDGRLFTDGITRDISGRKHAEEQQLAVADFGYLALTEHELEPLMDEASRFIRRGAGASAAVILGQNASGFAIIERSVPDDTALPLRRVLEASGADGIAALAVDADEPVVSNDLATEARFDASALSAAGAQSAVALALSSGELAATYVLVVLSVHRDAFAERDLAFIRSIANFISGAIARRAAEQQTLLARRDYRTLLEIAQEGILVLDRAGSIAFANPRVEEMVGRAPEALIGTSLIEHVVAEERQRVTDEANRWLLGESSRYETRMLRADGKLIDVTIAASPVFDDRGRMSGAMVLLGDITSRVRAEQLIRRSEAQLREAEAIAHVGSFEIDLENRIVNWSDELCRIAGIAQVENRVSLDATEATLLPSSFLATIEESGAVDTVYELTRGDGATRIVHLTARSNSDARERERIVGTVRDITDERAAQKRLSDREARLRLIVAHLPVIIWSTDPAMNITSLIGAGMQASLPELGITLDITEIVGEIPAGVDIEVAKQQAMTFETEQSDRHLRVHLEPLRDATGDVTGTVGIAFDVTQQRQAERARRDLLEIVRRAATEWTQTFDSISAPIVLLNADGVILRLNTPALRLTPYDDAAIVMGLRAESLPGQIWREIAAAVVHSLDNAEPLTRRIAGDDGRQWDMIASRTPDGSRVTVVASDITDIARMQENLQRTERMSAVGSLVAGVAHEVRNPLFGISATLDAFQARFGEEEFQPYTAALRDQINRMNELMHDLLEFGRPVPTVLVPGSPATVLMSVRSSMRPLLRNAGVTLELDVPPDLHPIRMDPHRLLQVFENLTKNAVQHSSDGATVEIIACNDRDAREVIVAVQDRGRGFATEDLPRIFEPFFTRRRGGTGLGLSLVQRIVEDHNGRIVAMNRTDGGASMVVTLPWAEDAD